MAQRGTPVSISTKLRVRQLANESDRVVIAAIARELGLSRPTVYKYLRPINRNGTKLRKQPPR